MPKLTVAHQIAHYFRWNTGTIETWWAGADLMVGFRCGTCGAMSGVHKSHARWPNG